ncbi:hypothetical protein GIB67_039905 [Kingdonia uniflora]|uniref:Uncharacterized protein n=1 Tax=Kingdonia uniflora TaxID=39325 RepID=A0A7J7P488_9MAGN|nr:hypothetical protein GIB67_039905 [Kingdonia uniflora]
MPEGDPHLSTLLEVRRVKFEDVQPQDIPNPTKDNFPRRCISQLPDGVSHIYYTAKELTKSFSVIVKLFFPYIKCLTKCLNEQNRDLMRVHGTFTAVFKVWKDIATLLALRDAVVKIFGQFMDIRLGNSDNRLIQYWFYEYCGVGHPIVKEEPQMPFLSSDSSIPDPLGLSSSSSDDDLIYNCIAAIYVLHQAVVNIVVEDATSSYHESIMGRKDKRKKRDRPLGHFSIIRDYFELNCTYEPW